MKAIYRPIFRGWRKNESGSVAVEFAFIGIILVVITLGAFELGRISYTSLNPSTAVGSTTRLIEMHAPDSVIVSSVSSHFSSSEQAALTVDIDPKFIIDGVTYTRVDAQYELPLIMPNLGIFPGNTYTLRARQLVPSS